MTLVQNHQQLLSGNKLFALAIAFNILMGCSPKVTQPVVVKEQPAKPLIEVPKAAPFSKANISVLVPFHLDNYSLRSLTKAQISKAEMPLDFYQGLMLGIDSAALTGLNFKVNIYDTKEDTTVLSDLLKSNSLRNSHLLIGPIFPVGIKNVTPFSVANKMPVISPLAATAATEFNNPNLITVTSGIQAHGYSIADYIAKNNTAENTIVVLINTKKADDEQFASPIKQRFAKAHQSFTVQEFASAYALETNMQKGKRYVVIVCADDTKFVAPTLTKLHRLKTNASYSINVIGHPNWLKQGYNVAQLQDLNTILSTSYYIDYKRLDVVNFIKAYRSKYTIEPTEYAFKGFDIGFYFGKQLAKHGLSFSERLPNEIFRGLHNTLQFEHSKTYGYYNTHVSFLQYKNLTLALVN